MGKTSFVIRKSWIPLFLGLSTEQAGELIQAIAAYQDGQNRTPTDQTLCAIYETIRAQMDDDTARYEEVCRQRAEAGRRGGMKKASNRKAPVANANACKQMLTQGSKSQQKVANDSKTKQNLPEYDYDCDNEYEGDSDKEKEKEKTKQKERERDVDNSLTIRVIPQQRKAAGGG